MMKQRFNSYEEVNQQLEILKIERQISYHRLMKHTSSISDSFTLPNFLKLGIGTIGNSIGNSIRNSNQFKVFIYTTLIKFVLRKVFKRKQL